MLRALGVVVLAPVLVTLVAAYRIMQYTRQAPVYPPPPGAVTSAQAKPVAERISAQPVVERGDLSLDLAPARASSIKLYVDGQQFFPAILADVRSARSSIHIEEYGITPGQVAGQFVPVFAA